VALSSANMENQHLDLPTNMKCTLYKARGQEAIFMEDEGKAHSTLRLRSVQACFARSGQAGGVRGIFMGGKGEFEIRKRGRASSSSTPLNMINKTRISRETADFDIF